jgi:hypothetical protein
MTFDSDNMKVGSDFFSNGYFYFYFFSFFGLLAWLSIYISQLLAI